MTQYELNDAIQTIASNLIASEALFLTFLSAYGVVAFTVGKKLTSYQISFVNFVFIAFMTTSLGGLYSMTTQVYHYGDQLIASQGEVVSSSLGEVVKWAMLLTRALMALGALGFMWQVRHAKTDELLWIERIYPALTGLNTTAEVDFRPVGYLSI